MLRTFVAALGLLLGWQLPTADAAYAREHGTTVGPAAPHLEVDARAGSGPIVHGSAYVAVQRDLQSRTPSGARAPATPPLPRFRARAALVLPTGGATRRYRRYFLYLPTAPPRSS
jgi:hypothetical protein